MPLPNLPDKQIAIIAGWVAAYISEQRETFSQKAQPLAGPSKKLLQPFFPADILENVRTIRARAPEPAFYPQLRALGIRNAPAFSQMAGITFVDVVLHVDPLTDSLLFHELVHAVQYKHLGLAGFAERYVRGFLNGGCYEEIPLEKQAYELEGAFAKNPCAAFSVEDDVKNGIVAHRF